MRIISGNKKSIVINAPKNLPVRPTTDKVKESLFNIIQNKFELNDCKVLDVFSGTGNISYEFASRGCNDILSVDNNFNCIRFINKTAKELEINLEPDKNKRIEKIKIMLIKYSKYLYRIYDCLAKLNDVVFEIKAKNIKIGRLIM